MPPKPKKTPALPQEPETFTIHQSVGDLHFKVWKARGKCQSCGRSRALYCEDYRQHPQPWELSCEPCTRVGLTRVEAVVNRVVLYHRAKDYFVGQMVKRVPGMTQARASAMFKRAVPERLEDRKKKP
jgi:hypothetical protein